MPTTLHEKVANVLNGIWAVQTPYYQSQVPLYTEDTLINNYGNFILGKNVIENAFIDTFENIALFESTKKHIFENPFAKRLKRSVNVARAKTFETFVNPINPLQYDGGALDRVLKQYKRDVKTGYFFRNRQDIFPVTLNREQLAGAFQSEEAFVEFIESFYLDMQNSNSIVEWNAIKQLIDMNTESGALKIVNVHGMSSAERWKLVKQYSMNMTMPSSDYNNYINIEGATGEPVVTSTPIESQLFMPTSDFIVDIENDVLAAAFQVEYATGKFTNNMIPVDNFNYNIYNRNTQEIIGTEKSIIKAVLCDEALIKFDEGLNTQADGENPATLSLQKFWHVWQTISIRPWCNCVVFVDIEADDILDVSVKPYSLMRADIPVMISTNSDIATTNILSARIGGIDTEEFMEMLEDKGFSSEQINHIGNIIIVRLIPVDEDIKLPLNEYIYRTDKTFYGEIEKYEMQDSDTLTVDEMINILREDFNINERTTISVDFQVFESSGATRYSETKTIYYGIVPNPDKTVFEALGDKVLGW